MHAQELKPYFVMAAHELLYILKRGCKKVVTADGVHRCHATDMHTQLIIYNLRQQVYMHIQPCNGRMQTAIMCRCAHNCVYIILMVPL